jgi:hypothetical protein
MVLLSVLVRRTTDVHHRDDRESGGSSAQGRPIWHFRVFVRAAAKSTKAVTYFGMRSVLCTL